MIAVWLRRFFGVTDMMRRRSTDQRSENRKPIHHPIKVHMGGQSVNCRTINLSASGALLNTALETPVGSTVQIEVSHLPRLVAARVARIGAHSTAIRFVSIEVGSSLVGSITAESARSATRSKKAHSSGRSAGAVHVRR